MSKYKNRVCWIVAGIVHTDREMAEYFASKSGEKAQRFDSIAEAARHQELELLAKGGRIKALQRQPRFPLAVNGKLICEYRPDWLYFEDGKAVAEDKKGFRNQVFELKFKLAKALNPSVEFRLS